MQSVSESLITICDRPLDQAMRQRATWHLLDWLGCALAAATTPVARAVANLQAGTSNLAVCYNAVGQPLAAAPAAFVNGALGNQFELDDVHRESVLHAGDVVIPAALAVAQQQNASPAELLDAIVRGYEAAIRVGLAAAQQGYSAWYNSGTCGTFGATIAAATVLRLNLDQQRDALGQAGMQAAGLWQCRLETTDSKQLATAHAARAGVESAQLAALGLAGARQIFEGELGFFKACYPDCDPQRMLDEGCSDWKIEEVSFKPWSACRHVHPAVEAGLGIQLAEDSIARITVATYQAALEFCDNPNPQTDHEARFSLQHAVAIALYFGEPRIEHFGKSYRQHPGVAGLRKRVYLIEDELLTAKFPARYGATLIVRCSDGSEHRRSVPSALGDPENPLSQLQLHNKFHYLASSGNCDTRSSAAAIEAILALPEQSTLNQVNEALVRLAQPSRSRRQDTSPV